MLAAGGYSWNAGIFLFRAARMRDAMLTHCRPIFEAADRALAAGMRDGDALYADAIEFAKAPSDSIDYAVMEKDDRVAVVPVAMGWSDLGRSEEHTSELQSLMRISYAVFCLKKKT